MSNSSYRNLRRTLAAAFICSLLAVPLGTAQAANNAEQVVFSGVGVPPVSSEPFGFWVWCQVEPASTQSHYDTDCQGAMYFYARGITKHVSGEVSEPEEGIYVMELEASGANVQCDLSNTTPIVSGPRNTVI
ncbi:MAG TPA: hypothetical protein VGQ93_01750, partial [Lysobacter sp.]|nr:hypothetical protein [Lysobacter sp.]